MSTVEQKKTKRVALLTAGGLAPCLSSAVGFLIERYTELAPEVELIGYRGGYRGLLLGDSFVIGATERRAARLLHARGGSPLGNSRVKLANKKDCEKQGLVKKGQDPRKAAADQLVRDRVDVLHTIGGDDTNTAAADLAAYLASNGYDLSVVGLPKTIDNDVIPIQQTLGALTAASEGARFFRSVVSDHQASHRTLIVHEVMGRSCGWLTAATAQKYISQLDTESWDPENALNQGKDGYSVHALYIPEMPLDLDKEAERLRPIMDRLNVCNIFVAEGAGAKEVVAEMEKNGQKVPLDAFGHPRLDAINVGTRVGQALAERLDAKKVEVQKSGYFSRAAPANDQDLVLIKSCADLAVDVVLDGFESSKPVSGVVGHDEERGNQLRAIEFPRIRGHKLFDITLPWFVDMMSRIGQPILRQPLSSKM